MMEYFQIKMMSASWRICRWFFWQILLFYCMPYLWLNHYDTATVVLMLLYTTSFSVYWEFASEANRFKSLWIPYLAYCAIAVTLCCSIGTWNASILFSLLIPLYGAALGKIISEIPKRKQIRLDCHSCSASHISCLTENHWSFLGIFKARDTGNGKE